MNNEFFDIADSNFDVERQKFIEHMNFLKTMSVEESTFYKKYKEIQDYRKYISQSEIVKSKIWKPVDLNDEKKTIDEINSIVPTLVFVESKQQNLDWLMLRVFGHTMEFSQTPGRFLKFLVTTGKNDEYIGAVSISSDVISIGCRDKHIGWTNDDKLKGNKRLNNSCIGSCIMSTQPFGYNFLGGKLIATLITTDCIQNIWERLYKQKLVCMSTTSLYGAYSMYDRIPWWKYCGESAGKISIKPDDEYYNYWHHWYKDNFADDYKEMMTQKEGVGGPVTAAKQRVINAIFGKLDIKLSNYVHGYNRGVYWSPFFENTREFLCNKISENDLIVKPNSSYDDKIKWWKAKAINRYLNLKKDNRLKPDVLYYNEIINMTYDEAKHKFFGEVGR